MTLYLPSDVIVYIFSEVDLFTLVSGWQVCKTWNVAIRLNPHLFWFKNVQVVERKRRQGRGRYEEEQKATIYECLSPFQITVVNPLGCFCYRWMDESILPATLKGDKKYYYRLHY
eukprot:TRINITY_DN1232_c0_g1_i2.p1 TRINITY_DN1232_c0_g1~~TRINITY_DN1232_c0_g1_i2.p1  ORF type:complete len:131 (+),score=11.63 TRINITY_DN1232_c0_g1_i2:51-395(+)